MVKNQTEKEAANFQTKILKKPPENLTTHKTLYETTRKPDMEEKP